MQHYKNDAMAAKATTQSGPFPLGPFSGILQTRTVREIELIYAVSFHKIRQKFFILSGAIKSLIHSNRSRTIGTTRFHTPEFALEHQVQDHLHVGKQLINHLKIVSSKNLLWHVGPLVLFSAVP